MPYVNIKVTGGPGAPTKEQKEALIKGATQLLTDVLGKHPKSTYVVIDVVELEDWGAGGQSLAQTGEKGQVK